MPYCGPFERSDGRRAALVGGAILLFSGGGSITFNCEIEDGQPRSRKYKLQYGKSLYVIDGVMGFNILPNAGQKPAAEITADKSGLHLSVTDEKQFHPEEVPKNVLGKTVVVRKKNGKKARFAFETA